MASLWSIDKFHGRPHHRPKRTSSTVYFILNLRKLSFVHDSCHYLLLVVDDPYGRTGDGTNSVSYHIYIYIYIYYFVDVSKLPNHIISCIVWLPLCVLFFYFLYLTNLRISIYSKKYWTFSFAFDKLICAKNRSTHLHFFSPQNFFLFTLLFLCFAFVSISQPLLSFLGKCPYRSLNFFGYKIEILL